MCQALRLMLAFFIATPLYAQLPRVLPPGRLPSDRRLGPLKDLDGFFPFVPCETRAAAEKRAEALRRRVLLAAGLWPMPPKTPLNAVIHGRIDRPDYTVEKVFFESYPGYYVTGNLYRPKGRSGKLPAVLCPHGHWPEGRFYEAALKEVLSQIVEGAERFEVGGRYPLQARCVQLARMGCVVFMYDMVGYGDSRQLVHRAGMRPEINDGRRWGFFSPQAEARLQTIFGLQTYNSIRALDFLCTLPDVDPERVAVTGASGGGTQTFILCAIDPRPLLAVPVVMVSTAMQGGCPCENASYLRIDTGNVELAGLMAPKPLGLIAANDWTKEIAVHGLPELRRHYQLFDAEKNIMARPLLQFPHNYNYVSRAVMYQWMNKHLKLGLEAPIVEEDFRPLTKTEMSVWDEHHPPPPGGDDFERELLQRLTEQSRRQLDALRPKDKAGWGRYRAIVGGAWEIMLSRKLPDPDDLQIQQLRSQEYDSWCMKTFLLRYARAGEELPVIQLEPRAWNRRTVIWVGKNGKISLFDTSGRLRSGVQKLLEHGFCVVGADLFGQGEFTPDGAPLSKAPLVRNRHAGKDDSWAYYAGFTFGYNHPLFARRVHDLLTLSAYASGKQHAAEAVAMVGLEGAGHWVAAARAIVGETVRWAAVDTVGFRFAALKAIDAPDFMPGGAKYDDLPGLMALSAPLPLWIAGEPEAEMQLVQDAYRASADEDKLAISPPTEENLEEAAVRWLLKEATPNAAMQASR